MIFERIIKIALTMLLVFFFAAISSCTPEEDNLNKANRDNVMRAKALEAIQKAYGSEEQEYGVTLFVNLHLHELDKEYWLAHTGTEEPSPAQVLDALVLVNKWESNGDVIYDYSLPDDVTQYVLGVRFDGNGKLIEITMES